MNKNFYKKNGNLSLFIKGFAGKRKRAYRNRPKFLMLILETLRNNRACGNCPDLFTDLDALRSVIGRYPCNAVRGCFEKNLQP